MNTVALIGRQLAPTSFRGRLISLMIFGLALPHIGHAAVFAVNSPADLLDANPGDGVCDTGTLTPDGQPECTLRAGVEESNTLPGGDVIRLPAETYTLSSGTLTILDNLAIEGEAADTTVIRANFLSGIFRVGTIRQGCVSEPEITPTVMISKVKMTGGRGVDTRFVVSRTGGAILNNEGSTLILESVIVAGNRASQGGGIANMGNLTLRRSTVSGNRASSTAFPADGGGGILNGLHDTCDQIRSAHALIENTTIGGDICTVIPHEDTSPPPESCGNQADKQGGGITNFGTLEIRNSTISGNTYAAVGGPSLVGGGGITNGGHVNVGPGDVAGGDVTLNNVTITNNRPRDGSAGGGILNLTFVTPEGESLSGTISLANTIVAGNAINVMGADCVGTLNSLGYNWIGPLRDCTITGDLTGTVIVPLAFSFFSDLFFPLENLGGPTETHDLRRLVVGTATAENGGNPAEPGTGGGACEPTDQRGSLRPAPFLVERCDVGAFERFIFNPPVCRGLPATIVGSPGDDGILGLGSFYGTEGPDVIHGLGGNDFIRGLGGDDFVCGDAGADFLSGQDGNDTLAGGSESDTLIGNRGADRLFGGLAGDLLFGNRGNDLLNGGPGADQCADDSGTNTLVSCRRIQQQSPTVDD